LDQFNVERAGEPRRDLVVQGGDIGTIAIETIRPDVAAGRNYWSDLQVAFLPEVSHPIIASEQLISTCSGSSRPSTRSALMTLSGHCEPIRERPLPDVPGNRRS
jgi:hypothetical protein